MDNRIVWVLLTLVTYVSAWIFSVGGFNAISNGWVEFSLWATVLLASASTLFAIARLKLFGLASSISSAFCLFWFNSHDSVSVESFSILIVAVSFIVAVSIVTSDRSEV